MWSYVFLLYTGSHRGQMIDMLDCDTVSKELELQSMFTSEQIPLRKVWTPLPYQL